MRLIILILVTGLGCKAQTWESVQTQEGSKLFHLLHGQYMALDVAPSPAPPAGTPTVSFSPQGPAILSDLAGRRIKGIGIDALVICSPFGAPVAAGNVYRLASQQGISWISPTLAAPKFRKTAAMSFPSLLLAAGAYGSLAVPVLGQAGVISMTSKFVIGLLGGHVLFDAFKSQVQGQLPDPTPFLNSLLDPETVLTFNGGCRESRIVTVYQKPPVSGTFPLIP